MNFTDTAARIAQFHNFFTDVAAQLPGFLYVPEPYRFDGTPSSVSGHLFCSEQKATIRLNLSLSTYAPTQRATAAGVYPQTTRGSRYHGADAPNTGFLVTRPAKDIAADITRRFLPGYKVYHAKALAYVQDLQKAEDRHTVTREQLQAAGFNFRDNGHEGYLKGTTKGDCSVYGESVDIKLRSLSADTVTQILNFLRQAA